MSSWLPLRPGWRCAPIAPGDLRHGGPTLAGFLDAVHRVRNDRAARSKLIGGDQPATTYPTGLFVDGASVDTIGLARRLGLWTRLHDLRHYAATQLIAGGVDLRTVSGRIGHAGGE